MLLDKAQRLTIRRSGCFVDLVPPEEVDAIALMHVMMQSAATPVMGYTSGTTPGVGSLPGSAAVLGRETGGCVGLVAASWVWDADEVAEIVIFMDRARIRAGAGPEAVYLFSDELFAQGVRRVMMRVLAINASVLALMRRIGKAYDARLREQHFLGGQFVDEYVFSWSATDFSRLLEARPRLALVAQPGGDRRRPRVQAVRLVETLEMGAHRPG